MNTRLSSGIKCFGLISVLLLAMLTPLMHAQSGFPVVPPSQAGFDAERLERVTALYERYVDEGRMAGGVLMVLRDGKEVMSLAVGYQDKEAEIPMETGTIFRIASQTKAIISVGVMILLEEGKLLIEQPVADFLPEFRETTVAVADGEGGYTVEPASRPITIRDLLLHTAGIGYGFGTASDQWAEAGIQGFYLIDKEEPIRELVRRLAALPQDAHPGERFVYGYANDILGALIEVASGEKLDAFLQNRIFDPLGMADTHFFLPEEKRDRLAVVYSGRSDGPLERAPDPGRNIGQGHYIDGPGILLSGGAGLVSTVGDYARFLQMMLNEGELDGKRLLAPSTVRLMTVNHLDGFSLRPGVGVGLGFDVVTDLGQRGIPGAVGDYGWGGAYGSTYWVSPRDRLVVIHSTQLSPPPPNMNLRGKTRALIYQALMD